MLLIREQPLTTLRIVNDAFSHLPVANRRDRQISSNLAPLYKNRAKAEYHLGFDAESEADAKTSLEFNSTAASAYCILGEIYAKRKQDEKANAAWEQVRAFSFDHEGVPRTEPDCILLAEVKSHEANR